MTAIKDWNKYQHYKHRDPPWIRLYRGLLNDREWHNLDGDDAKALVMLWLIASEREGSLPPVQDLAFRLRMTEARCASMLSRLDHWLVQDASTPLAECGQDATPETETETETETEQKEDIRAVATATRPDDHFDEFWKAYPKRQGANPSAPARKRWDAAIKSGVDPHLIIKAVKSGVGYDPAKINTEYIPRASTWLNEQRWKDYREAEVVALAGFYAPFGSAQLDAWDKTKPGGYPRDKAGGWRFPSEWPPDHERNAA
jgi:hypothetical protein